MAQKEPAQKAESGKKRPHRIPIGRGISAIIWENGTGDDVWYNVEVIRTYKAENGLNDCTNYRRDDLLFVAKAAHMAFDWIWEQKKQTRSTKAAT